MSENCDVNIFQDEEDKKLNVVQLSLTGISGNTTIYFSKSEWQAFKDVVNKFEYDGKNNHFDLNNNPVQSLSQDGYAVKVDFWLGELTVMLYFENLKRYGINHRWEYFKEKVNSFSIVSK